MNGKSMPDLKAQVSKTDWHEIAIDLLAVSLIFCALFYQYLFFGRAIPTGIDMPIFTHPSLTFTGSSLADGVLPMWNPYWFCGFPHLAAPRMGVFYPTTALFGFLEFARALKIDTFAHILLMGAFSYFLGRNLFKSRIASISLATMMMSGGIVLSLFFFAHTFALHTLTYMPLSLLFVRKILTTGKFGWSIALAVVTMLQIFAGDLQILSYVLLICGLYTFIVLVLFLRKGFSKQTLLEIVWKGGYCLAGIILGLLCAAIQIIPTMELVEESIRSGEVHPDFVRAGIIMPEFYWKDVLLKPMHLQGEGTIMTLYIPFVSGALTFALMGAAFWARKKTQQVIFLVLALFCLLYTLMPDFFLHNVVMHIPVLNKGRFLFRVEFVLIFLYYILICYGINNIVCRQSDRPLNRYWNPVLIVALITIVLAMVQQGNTERLRVLLFAEAIALAILAITAVVQKRIPRWAGACILILVFLESGDFARNRLHVYFPFNEPARMDSRYPNYVAFTERFPIDDRVALFSPGLFNRALPQASSMASRVRTLGGYHGLPLQRMMSFLEALTPMVLVARDAEGRLQGEDPMAYSQDWVTPESYAALDLLNVRLLVSAGLTLSGPMADETGRFNVGTVYDLNVYENLKAFPVAFTVHDVVVVDTDEEALALLSSSDFDHRNTAVLTESFDDTVLKPASRKEPVTVVEYGINHVELSVDMETPGFVVLTDTFYPGWHALVDGKKKSKVYPVDTILRGVYLEPGPHTVRFYFRPTSILVGGAITSLALGFVIVYVAWLLFAGGSRISNEHG